MLPVSILIEKKMECLKYSEGSFTPKRKKPELGEWTMRGTMTLKDFENLFDNESTLASRNEKSRAIARDILVFGKTQRQTAKDNDVTLPYVNVLMKSISSIYKRKTLPIGYVLLENIVLPARDAAHVLKLAQKTDADIKLKQKRGVS
jgi:hypothetical protein